VFQETEHPVADQVGRRLVPGKEQQYAGGEQFVVAQDVSVGFRRDERTQQVIPGPAAPLSDGRSQVISEFLLAFEGAVYGRECVARNDQEETRGYVV
jgi:hypothetical protein